MKLIKGLALICVSGFFDIRSSDFELEDPGYKNQILAIEEFDSPNSTKIMISFENQNPICTYSPENFQESLDDTVYRAFMPRTGIASGVGDGDEDDIDCDQAASFDLEQTDAGVELLLYGASIRKYNGRDHVMFVVKK